MDGSKLIKTVTLGFPMELVIGEMSMVKQGDGSYCVETDCSCKLLVDGKAFNDELNALCGKYSVKRLETDETAGDEG